MGKKKALVSINKGQEKQWSVKHIKAILLLGNLDSTKPEYEIAVDVGIRPETLSRWKRKPKFMEAVNKLLDQHIKAARPAIWKRLVQMAKGKSFLDRKLFFELIGEYKQKEIEQKILIININKDV